MENFKSLVHFCDILFNKLVPRSEHELEDGNFLFPWSFSLIARTSYETQGDYSV